jgi:signal transduction histidine kinase
LFGEPRLSGGVLTLAMWNRLAHPDDRARIRAQRHAMRAGTTTCFLYRIVRPADGATRWVETLAVVSATDARGRPMRIVGALWDVTAREAQRHRDAQLRRLGFLVAGVVHDFGNVLQAVSSNAERVAASARGNEPIGRAAARILSSAARGAAIVERLHPRSGRASRNVATLDAGEVVRAACDLIAWAAGPDMRLAIDIAPDLPPVAVDRAELETALVNLAVNARDAMRCGGTIRISVARMRRTGRGRGGQWLSIALGDDGHGMDEATRRGALEPFFTTKPAADGSGLGLPLVADFARRHGGDLLIDSAPGRGTCVTIALPAHRVARAPHAPAPGRRARPASASRTRV